MKNAAKSAGLKLSHLEPGQIVRDLSGARYRVASKVAGPDGSVIKLANLNGEPVSFPAKFTPVGAGMARFAAMMRYHLAYDRNLDQYISAYCQREGLPVPVGPDGQPFRWAAWFQNWFAPKLRVPQELGKDVEPVRDEAIIDMVNTVLAEREILSDFKQKMKNFHKDIRKLDEARQLTVYLVKSFKFRLQETQQKLFQEKPQREMSMIQPIKDNDEEEELNILDTEEHAHVPAEFQNAESQRDIARLREGFSAWLGTKLTPKAAQWFTELFDIYWEWIQGSSDSGEAETLFDVQEEESLDDLPEDKREKAQRRRDKEERKRIERLKQKQQEQRPGYMPARRELEPQWMERTNLNKASLYAYIGRLADLLGAYIKENRAELGNTNIFVELIEQIEQERSHLKRGPKKNKSMPAHASLAALEIASVDQGMEPVTGGSPAMSLDQLHDKMSAEKTAKEVTGGELTPEMRQQVLNSFPYRWTSDNPQRLTAYKPCESCDIQHPFVGGNASGHNHPTIPLISDDQWLQKHKFHFFNDGRLNPRRHAEPLLSEPNILAPVAAEDKTAEFAENILPADLPTEEETMSEGAKMERDHLYCPECKECVTCNLRPCRNGEPHQPGVPLDQKWDNLKQGAGQLNCCGGWHNQHKSNCPVYNDNFNKTIETLQSLPKRSAANDDLAEAAENVMQARADKMLTAQDWDLLNESLRYANRGPLEAAARALLHAHDQQPAMVTSEEWENLAAAIAKETGRNVGWRSHDEQPEDSLDPGVNPYTREKEATEPLMELRPQTMEDTGRLPHARKEGATKVAWKLNYVYRDGQRIGEGFVSKQDAQIKVDNDNLLIDQDEGSFFEVREEDVPWEEYNAAQPRARKEGALPPGDEYEGYKCAVCGQNNLDRIDGVLVCLTCHPPRPTCNCGITPWDSGFHATWCNLLQHPEAFEEQRAVEDLRTFEENNLGSNVTVTPESFKPRRGSKTAGMWSVKIRDSKGKPRFETVNAINYKGAERAVATKMKSGEEITSMSLAKAQTAAGEMSEVDHETYPQWFQMAEALGGTVEPFDQYQGPYVHVPGIGKFWINDKTGDNDFVVFNESNGRTSPVDLYYGEGGITAGDAAMNTLDHKQKAVIKRLQDEKVQPNLFKDSAGPVSPQQMQEQNVQKSQGVVVPPQQPAIDPNAPQQPNVAIMPESGVGDGMPMRKTVPPELPNRNFHMSNEKKAAPGPYRGERDPNIPFSDNAKAPAGDLPVELKAPRLDRQPETDKEAAGLKTEQNTPQMGEEVEALAQTHPETEVHKYCTATFEHGQWWVTCNCGAIWSVVDVEPSQFGNGLDLESIDDGDGGCQQELEEEDPYGPGKMGSAEKPVLMDKNRFFEGVMKKHPVL